MKILILKNVHFVGLYCISLEVCLFPSHSKQTTACIYFPSYARTDPPSLEHPSNACWGVQIINLISMQFSTASYPCCLWVPNIVTAGFKSVAARLIEQNRSITQVKNLFSYYFIKYLPHLNNLQTKLVCLIVSCILWPVLYLSFSTRNQF
jgi:hypothetical protein